ncbi:protein translocase subunit SecF [Halostella sp. PRR32]|uniref:protein translocase subunit SecF n=1 Tax=Halostella sp. PRR32 TaxID=3098147 RepID=UPI002B1D2B5B|nr:protein translocase subunit SecF [Halostella sp. PRR32]
MVEIEVPEIDYTRYTNRQLAAIPLAVLAVALAILLGWYLFTGAPVNPGTAFTGGAELTIQTDQSEDAIRTAFDQEPSNVRSIRGEEDTYIVEFPPSDIGALESQADDAGFEVLSSSSTSPSFGSQAQTEALYGVVIAFVGMSVLAFAFFRTFVPSIAIVISAFSDIVIPLALMNVFGIDLTLGTIAALLMLIGYSVDSDILLNNHILRRSGEFYDSTHRAMRTGVTMTLTSISAMAVMAIVATLFGIDLLSDIGLILVFGLTADLMNTYMLNLSLLRWYKFEGVAR